MGRDAKANPFSRQGAIISAEPPQVREIYGRVLQEGDQVQLNLEAPPLYKVMKIGTSANPQLPPGVMEVVLQSTVQFHAPRNLPCKEFIRVIQVAPTPLGDQPGQDGHPTIQEAPRSIPPALPTDLTLDEPEPPANFFPKDDEGKDPA